MINNAFPPAAELVEQYIHQVESGTGRSVGQAEAAAVARYRHDRQHAHQRGWYFDEKMAARYVDILPHIVFHSTGQWAGEPFIPSPWQAWCLWNIHGWRSADNKTRRFRKAYITVARKNGKTFFAAALTVQVAFIDLPFEPRTEVYCAATKESQAKLTWDEARRIVQASPTLDKHARVRKATNTIELPGAPWRETTIKPVGADGRRQDGLNPVLVIKDEYHAWTKTLKDLDEKLSTGGAARLQPLEVIITTAGDEDSALWAELDEYATRVNASGAGGQPLDDTLFAFIARADADVDPYGRQAHEQANPNIGVSVSAKYLKDKAAEAQARPSARRPYKRYHINRLTASFEQTYPEELWAMGAQTFPVQDGAECFLAFDLGRSNDWAAAAAVFPQFEDDAWRFAIRTRSWACRGTNPSVDYDAPPFVGWIQSGLLEFQREDVLNYDPLRDWILAMAERYHVREVAFDGTFAGDFAQRLETDYSLPMFEFFQTYRRYTAPIKNLERDLLAGRIGHAGDLVLAWQAGNAQTVENKQGQIMVNKGEGARRKKVDAIVATLMAYGECTYHLQQDTGLGFVFIS